MATWDEMESLTWDELEGFSWDEVARLSVDQIQRWTREIWPVIANLSEADRNELRDGLFDGTMPPALLADGFPRYSKAQAAALSIWTRLLPDNKDQAIAYVAVLVSLLTSAASIGVSIVLADHEPPPVTVIIQQMPEHVRPNDPEVVPLPHQPHSERPNPPKDT